MDEHTVNIPPAKATVLMPVYNAGMYLKEAIQSITGQTFTDFTFLIINDGSTDNSEDIIKEFADERIQYVKHETNKGLIATLNEGLSLINTEYIIRMDADDVSFANRFEKQVAYMAANPDIAISGTWMATDNGPGKVAHPASADACKVMLLDNTVLAHPSAIIRREAIAKRQLQFDKDAIHAEDYKFWTDASASGLKIANLPEILMSYRTHAGQVSAKQHEQQLQSVKKIRLQYANHFFAGLLSERKMVYDDLINQGIGTFGDFIKAKALVKKMNAENRAKGFFDIAIFEDYLARLIKSAAFRMYIWGIDCNLRNLCRAIFDGSFYTSTSISQKVRFVIKSFGNAFT